MRYAEARFEVMPELLVWRRKAAVLYNALDVVRQFFARCAANGRAAERDAVQDYI